MQTTKNRLGRGLVAATIAAAFVLTAVPQGVGQGQPELERRLSSRAAVDPAVTSAAADGPVEVVVRATPSTVIEVQALAADLGTVTQSLPIVDGFAATLDAEAIETLAATPGVIAISLDGIVTLGTAGGGSSEPDSSYVETIGADVLHAQGIDGTGVGIAILDTGVTEVADLAGRIVGAADFAGDGDHLDHYGHGTFIAGVAAGNGAASFGEHAGVAPGAHVIPVKITGLDGSSDVTHVLAGIQYAVSFADQYDIGVINLSLGTDSSQSWLVDPLNYAVEKAWDAGIVVVASGANLGPDSQTITKPADDPLVIAVGSTDSNGTIDRSDDTVPDFSSRGPTRDSGRAKPDLVAPGVSIVGLRAPGSWADLNAPEARVGTDYFRGSGTSFSTAVVSGAVALLRQAHPSWTPDQIKGALLGTAAAGPVGNPNVDGHGAIDVAAAAALSNPTPANQGVARSTGLGSLDLSRGTMQVQIQPNNLLQLLTGLTTAQNKPFDAVEFTSTEWYGAQWYGAQWYGAQWYGAQWYGAQWYGAQWYGAQWY